jgi:hypothetical protein
MGLGCAGERNEKTAPGQNGLALDDQSARRLVHEIENPETAAAVNVLQPRRKTAIDDDPTQSDDSMPFFGQCCRRCHGVDGAEKIQTGIEDARQRNFKFALPPTGARSRRHL